jgi:hypothetical protein
MATRFPRGVFSLDHRGWSLDNLTYLSYGDANGSASAPYLSLYNDSRDGNTLALFGILGFYGYSVPLLALTLKQGGKGSTPTTVTQQNVDPLQPTRDGTIQFTNTGGNPVNRAGLIWWADGRTWLESGGAPLLLIPPGYRAEVTLASLFNNSAIGAPIAVTFLYGYA